MRILIPITVMMTGCGSHYANSNFVATQSPPFAIEPIPAGNVAVISTAPTRPFVELGFIESDSFDGYGEAPEWALVSMRTVAGRHGCDALLVTGTTTFVDHERVNTVNRIGYHGACLAFTDKPRTAPTAQGAARAPQGSAPAPHHGLLFRNAEGNVYRVSPEARDAALHAGWVQIGAD